MMDDFGYNQPNTRARIAARRKRSRVPRTESGVLPGPRRAAGQWLASGHAFSLVLLLTSLAGLLYIAFAPQFVIQTVHVNGAQTLSEAEVAELAGATGQSIWLVQTDAIVARIAGSAYVEQASASVALPDVLTINLVERRPELRWQAGNTRFLIDGDGRVLGPDTTATLTNTLIIEDRSGRAIEANDRIDPEVLQLSRLLALRLPGEAGVTPAGISWDPAQGVTIATTDGRTIVFGRMDNLEAKIKVLRFLTIQEPTEYTYLDLRPAAPYYRNDGPPPQPETP